MQLTQTTIFITGGTSGIGLGLAIRLAELGNTVIISGRRKALLDEITAEHAGIEGVELDVQDPESIAAAFATVTTTHPDVNVVINLAGIMLPEDLVDPDQSQSLLIYTATPGSESYDRLQLLSVLGSQQLG